MSQICVNCQRETSDVLSEPDSWCSICQKKTEIQLYEWVMCEFDCPLKKNAIYMWSIINERTFLDYDIAFDHLRLFLILDSQNSTPLIKEKIKLAIENQYSCVTILRDNIYHNRNDWQINLKNIIKPYDTPQLINLVSI